MHLHFAPVAVAEGRSPGAAGSALAQAALGEPPASARPSPPRPPGAWGGGRAGGRLVRRLRATKERRPPSPRRGRGRFRPTSRGRAASRSLVARAACGAEGGRRSRGCRGLRPVDELLFLCCLRSAAAPFGKEAPPGGARASDGRPPCGGARGLDAAPAGSLVSGWDGRQRDLRGPLADVRVSVHGLDARDEAEPAAAPDPAVVECECDGKLLSDARWVRLHPPERHPASAHL